MQLESTEYADASESFVKPSNHTSGPSLGFKEFVAVVISLSAFATTLFYFTGRAFMRAYFQQMNIPYHQFELSVWEYGEVGWGSIAYYLFRFATYCLVGAISGGLILLGGSFFWISVSTRLSHLHKRNQKQLSQLELSGFSLTLMRYVLAVVQIALWIVIGIGLVIALLTSATEDASTRGMAAGGEALLNAQHLTLVTDNPLDISGGTVIESGKSVLYRYDNLYMLTYNAGRYFAYRTLNSATCRPEEVLIIDAKQVKQAVLGLRPTNAPRCEHR